MKTCFIVAALLLAESSAISFKHQQREFDFDDNLVNEEKDAHASMAWKSLAEQHQKHMMKNEELIKEYTHQID